MGRTGSFDRRRFLGWSAGVAGAALLSQRTVAAAASSTVRRAASVKAAGSDLGALEHVIFVMVENRSFDHFFGTYPGVRGFDDRPRGTLGPFAQRFPGASTLQPPDLLLPFRLTTVGTANAECTFDLTHDWAPQHQSWNHGRMDRFVAVHTDPANEGPTNGVLTMGYYTRADLPYYYALADAFTIGDAYHCSVMGPTDPNRMMQMSGTIDEGGSRGGPVIKTASSHEVLWTCRWDTIPEVLEDRGIAWKYYRPAGDLYTVSAMESLGITYDTVLPYFASYQDPSTPLHQKAFDALFPDDFQTDVRSGKLPQVSWISAALGYDDHPPGPPALGMWFLDQLLRTLVAVPEVWSRTVVFFMCDENDGFFDHVPPPVPPAGTPGEYLTTDPLPSDAGGVAGPIGLGFRVPFLVLSPFSRGGHVCSDLFDHTSQLRFLEARFDVRAPNLSAWRRRTVGDLTSTLRLASPNTSVPTLPPTSDAQPAGCQSGDLLEVNGPKAPYPVPNRQRMPRQETTRRHRSGNHERALWPGPRRT